MTANITFREQFNVDLDRVLSDYFKALDEEYNLPTALDDQFQRRFKDLNQRAIIAKIQRPEILSEVIKKLKLYPDLEDEWEHVVDMICDN